MLHVKVCVGSSCHIRGGARTMKLLQSLIESHGLSTEVSLSADLCLDNCLQAPNVVIEGTIFGSVTPDRVEEFFENEVLPRVVVADADTRDHNYQ